MTEKLDLAELERLAIDAKDGVTRSDGWTGTVETGDHLARDEAFMKVASPETVLALIARVRELEEMEPVGWVKAHVKLGDEPPNYTFTQDPEAVAAWHATGVMLPRVFARVATLEEHVALERTRLREQINAQKRGGKA